MDPISKLEKISEKSGGILKLVVDATCHTRSCIVSWKQDGYKAPEQEQVLGESSDPRDAINKAFTKVCTPIPRTCEGWNWDSRMKKWIRGAVIAHFCTDVTEENLYRFTLDSEGTQIAAINGTCLGAFEKLRKVNPRLEPPTEE